MLHAYSGHVRLQVCGTQCMMTINNYHYILLELPTAPHQPRLDWQMWFAALGSYQNNPWLVHLVYRLLIGQREGESMYTLVLCKDIDGQYCAYSSASADGPAPF